MTIKVTKDEATMITNGLEGFAVVLRNYADQYNRNGDRENAKDCVLEAGKYYDLCNSIRQMVREG